MPWQLHLKHSTSIVEQDVVEFLWRQGERLRTLNQSSIPENRLEGYFELLGGPAILSLPRAIRIGKPSQAFRTLFMQEMIRRGVIAPSFVVSFSHYRR